MDWGLLHKYREEIGENILKIPVCDGANKVYEIIPDSSKVLDIGAGPKYFKDELLKRKPNCVYKSMDVDKTFQHDYYSINKINNKFDVILMSKVVEHITIATFTRYLNKIKTILNDNGKLIIVVPNVLNFNYLYDVTHKQHWPHRDLYAYLRMQGFSKVDVFRMGGRIFRPTIKLPFILARHVFRLMYVHSIPRTDYCENIMVVGSEPAK